MKVLIFGATGMTGKALTSLCLDAGHHVTIMIRNPQKWTETHPNLTVVVGQLTDLKELNRAMQGQEIVISVLGPVSLTKENTEFMEGLKNIVTVAETTKPNQFFYVSTMGVGDSRECLDWFSKHIVMDQIIKKSVSAHSTNEALVTKSDLDWTIFRPAKLTNGPLTKQYRFIERIPYSRRPKISRLDVAYALIQCFGKPEHLHKTFMQMY